VVDEAAPPSREVAAVAATTREMTPEEKEFMDALTQLFTTAQEFGLTLASLETDIMTLPADVRECIEQGREVAKAVKRFQRLIRRRMRVQ